MRFLVRIEELLRGREFGNMHIVDTADLSQEIAKILAL